jgi:tetratricopeptide (TPR) repeat protein
MPRPVRITKRQMKEDKLVTTTFKVTEFVQTHSRTFIIALVALAAVTAVVVFTISSRSARSREAAGLLGRAYLTMTVGNAELSVSDLKTIVEDYGNSSSAPLATYYLADLYFRNGSYEEALEYFQLYVDEYHHNQFLTVASLVGVADSYMELGRPASAGEFYLKAFQADTAGLEATRQLLRSGQAYLLAGEKQKAKEVFQQIIDDYPYSLQIQDARMGMAEATLKD